MALNPMHQFEVYKIGPEINLNGVNISFTNASLFMTISSEKKLEQSNINIEREGKYFSPLIVGLFLTFGGIIIVLIASEMLVYSAIEISTSCYRNIEGNPSFLF